MSLCMLSIVKGGKSCKQSLTTGDGSRCGAALPSSGDGGGGVQSSKGGLLLKAVESLATRHK